MHWQRYVFCMNENVCVCVCVNVMIRVLVWIWEILLMLEFGMCNLMSSPNALTKTCGDYTLLHFVTTCDNGVFNGGIFMHLSVFFSFLFVDIKLPWHIFKYPMFICNYLERPIFSINSFNKLYRYQIMNKIL